MLTGMNPLLLFFFLFGLIYSSVQLVVSFARRISLIHRLPSTARHLPSHTAIDPKVEKRRTADTGKKDKKASRVELI